MTCLRTLAGAMILAGALAAQTQTVDIRKVLTELAAKLEPAKEYAFDGDLQLDGQRGERPGRTLAKAKVKIAVAPGGKYLLEIAPVDKDEYLLASDGQKSWAYVPKLKQYTEQEAATVVNDFEDDEDGGGGSDTERDLAETFAHTVVPTLARMRKTAEAADTNGFANVKYEGKKDSWPVIRVLSRKDAENGRDQIEIAVDPATLRLGRMVWRNLSFRKGEKMLLQLTVDFSSFRVGETLPQSTFIFTPPKKAKLVDAVPIPGQTGSFLLNQPAPDFEVKSVDGERVRLSDLRGRPVILNFWASWCGPCRRELPGLAKVQEAYKDKGLVVFGVNDEGKGTAREFAGKMNLTFATLDDSSLKIHRLYRVRSIPTLFLIDGNGKIVRYLSGAHHEDEIRKALRGVGLD